MPTPWQATDQHTVPASSTMAEGQIKDVSVDATLVLGTGQVPTSPAAILRRLDTRATVASGATLPSTPITGNIITVRVTGITRDVTHELEVSFDHTNPRVAGERSVMLHVIEGVG